MCRLVIECEAQKYCVGVLSLILSCCTLHTPFAYFHSQCSVVLDGGVPGTVQFYFHFWVMEHLHYEMVQTGTQSRPDQTQGV